jgi:uncharacterized protein YlbG (UPF0298 family)
MLSLPANKKYNYIIIWCEKTEIENLINAGGRKK